MCFDALNTAERVEEKEEENEEEEEKEKSEQNKLCEKWYRN